MKKLYGILSVSIMASLMLNGQIISVGAATISNTRSEQINQKDETFDASAYTNEIDDFVKQQDTKDVKALFAAIVNKEKNDIQKYGSTNEEQIRLLWGAYIFYDIGFVGDSIFFPMLLSNASNNSQIKSLIGYQADQFLPNTKMKTIQVKNNEDGNVINSVAYYTPHNPDITANADKTVVMHGGFRGNIDSGNDNPEVRTFYDKGYNILFVDNRATSKSGGSYVTFGQYESDDVIAWIQELNSNINPNQKVVLYGGSMGASTMMSVLAKNYPGNVQGLIENCGYASIKDELGSVYIKLVTIGKGLINEKIGADISEAFLMTTANETKMMNTLDNYYIKPKVNVDISGDLPILGMKNSTLPKLFIHGTADLVVPFKNMQTLMDNNSGESYSLAVSGAGHGEAQTVDPDGYAKAVQDYLDVIFK
jgi:pimeloyl-ACP methyl ester carboxylesterase